ncbi:MAG: 30S ribosomal protein S15 [bacterium]
MPKPIKTEIIGKFKAHATDTGSAEVQIALLTYRINHLTNHLKSHRKDLHSRVGLVKMVSERRRYLRYLMHKNEDKYRQVLQELSLRK